jgi:dihydroxyacid dehydratase/phosphogluconate dehydratase
MPELHKLTPTLSILQDRGQRVALLTDGRMSGASGTVLAAIHVVPEAAQDGAIGRLQDGDPIEIDAERGELECRRGCCRDSPPGRRRYSNLTLTRSAMAESCSA